MLSDTTPTSSTSDYFERDGKPHAGRRNPVFVALGPRYQAQKELTRRLAGRSKDFLPCQPARVGHDVQLPGGAFPKAINSQSLSPDTQDVG